MLDNLAVHKSPNAAAIVHVKARVIQLIPKYL